MEGFSSYNPEKRNLFNFQSKYLLGKEKLENNSFNSIIHSFREGNNFAYASGKVNFLKKCDNVLVISDAPKFELSDVRDKFILVREGSSKVFPITEIPKFFDEVFKNLEGKQINYNIPKSVLIRESLLEKDMNDLLKEVGRRYSINPVEIKSLKGGRTNFGVFYVKDTLGKEYVLKYQGQNSKKAESIARVSNLYPEFFSKFFPRSDNNSFTFKLEDGLYGLEEFIRGGVMSDKDRKRFKLIGQNTGRLHKNLEDFLESNPHEKSNFKTSSRHISESNLLSFLIDLGEGHKRVKEEIWEILNERVSEKIHSLPEVLIHGDLNLSNLIWKGKNYKIIDKETMVISRRILDFNIPLLYLGPEGIPHYTSGSIIELERGLEETDRGFSSEEAELIKPLLKYSLIKNYVVRNIRRKLNQLSRLKILEHNLEKIERDKYG